MSKKYKICLILICGIWQALASSNVSISSSHHDLQLLVSQSQNVTFFVTGASLIQDSFEVHFESEPDGVVALHPPDLDIGTQNMTSFAVSFVATGAGRATVTSNATSQAVDVKEAFVRVVVQHSAALAIFSQVIGWVYFVAWSVSFYPQIYENWKRKSVIGLSFDFLGLNVVGFFLYSLFNVALYWIKPIQDEYFSRHPTGVNPVQLNDVIFSLHAVFACIITIIQCIIYERGNQAVSRICKLILVGIVAFLVISFILSLSNVLKYLDFLYFCSYVKLFITLIKYVPQAYLNFRRKSTMGWSIGNILLDFTGGILSIGQMFVIAYNQNDWSSLFGDPTKFGLGLFSVLFDILFILQHYVFYRNNFPSQEIVNDDTRDADEEIHSESDYHS